MHLVNSISQAADEMSYIRSGSTEMKVKTIRSSSTAAERTNTYPIDDGLRIRNRGR